MFEYFQKISKNFQKNQKMVRVAPKGAKKYQKSQKRGKSFRAQNWKNPQSCLCEQGGSCQAVV